ncbi:60s ribosomal protein l37 mitochondrial precursor [Melampsora larici-populina 98AG31]|uniref:Large ribosomal subunit protein mL54 n=1 Tax=Melampsora larici-populina (strain 98AG31 / pathotype 3-4-7) TaxID=747676 RepID=F4R320_MELLP|nr:60s ribosomal protein l37 mitochondrial precursor [Melampsora larici-populina 98AG31]EGG13246.1 60s ribosomal protein l37 mitochondrial precursor [Melampsora larici-populina 98AG31]
MTFIHQLKKPLSHSIPFAIRSISSSSSRHQKPIVSSSSAGQSTPISSVKAGTPLKGLGIIKGVGDPVAKPDEEYPSWLWSLIEPGMGAGKSDEPLRAIRRELNRENRNKIRNSNFLKGNK